MQCLHTKKIWYCLIAELFRTANNKVLTLILAWSCGWISSFHQVFCPTSMCSYLGTQQIPRYLTRAIIPGSCFCLLSVGRQFPCYLDGHQSGCTSPICWNSFRHDEATTQLCSIPSSTFGRGCVKRLCKRRHPWFAWDRGYRYYQTLSRAKAVIVKHRDVWGLETRHHPR